MSENYFLKKVFFLVSVLTFGFSFSQTTGFSGTGDNIDVIKHNIFWRVNPDSIKYIKGKVVTHFITKKAGVSRITFDLNKASYNNANLVVKYNGAVVNKSFATTGNVLNIDLPVSLPINTRDSISISYAGVSPAEVGNALGYQKAVYNSNNYIYTLSESYEDRDWWPCKADMQDKIESMRITVSTPAGFKVATQGKLVSTVSTATENKYTYVHNYPIASYLVSLGVAKYTEFDRGTVDINGTLTPVLYQLFPRTSYTSILAALDNSKAELQLYSQLFGDYPFKNEKFGVYEFGFSGGMEHQTNIGLNASSLTSWSVIAHEIAHQWFGDAVTCGTWSSLWLNEGFASYLEALAAEKIPTLGQSAKTRLSSFKTSARSVTVPVHISNISNSDAVWTSANDTAVYQKGAMIVSMIRTLLGDDKFFATLKNYAEGQKYSSANTETFKQYVSSQLGGYNIDGFFQDWVYGIGTPDYTLQWNNSGNNIVLKLTQKRSTNSNVAYFRMPVVIQAKSSTGAVQKIVLYDELGKLSQIQNGVIGTSTGTNSIVLTLPFTPSSVVFDENAETIATATITKNTALVATTPDTVAPSAPTTLSASGTTQNSTNLSWVASTDNVGVTGYDVYQGTTLKGSTTSTSYAVTGLTASTAYTFTVKAKDAAGNVSAASNSVSVTTSTPVLDTTVPTAPTLSASGTTSNSTSLSWSGATDNIGVTGYDVYKDGILLGSTTASTYAVSGLSASTTYLFTVKAKDTAGNVSVASNAVSVTTLATSSVSYCTSQGNSTADEKIAKVVLGTISNSSTGTAGYENFTSLSTNVTNGTTYTITITPKWTSTVYSEGYAVFIDYNEDGDFADSGETVFTKAASKTTPIAGSFTIPTTALSGAKRMRVSMKYNAIPTACETFSYGQVEDYTVNITASTARVIPKSEIITNAEIIIYPNPVKNVLHLSRMNKNSEFEIYNSSGQLVKKGIVNSEINMIDLPSGIYIVSIRNNNMLIKKKIIKE